MEVKICPACGSETFKFFLTCIDHAISKESFNLKICNSCSLIVTSPRPDNATLGQYYISKSYISHTSQSTTLIDKIYLIARNFTLKRKLKLVSRSFYSNKTILDYGCGTGDFLNTCKSNGWSVSGVEPSDIARKKASALLQQPICKSIDEETNKFDVITLWHVLEHIPDLNKTLEKLKTLLAENGTIFIAVPNTECHDAKTYQELWGAYDVPRHLWHFNQNNMKALLSQFSMKVTRIHPMKLDSYYVSILSEKYKTNDKLTLKGLIKAFLIGVISNLKARRTDNYSSLIYVVQNEIN